MIRGRVLVIDNDETVEGLVRVLREKGYEVDQRTEARAGFHRACEAVPDCILCNPDLPDIDGAWVARRVRTESGALSRVPFLFVGAVIDKTVRTQALGVGVDVFLARPPASDEEIAAQVDALVAMARRFDAGSEERGAPSSTFAAAIRGDLSAFPLASMLMMFEMERRSGVVQVVAESGKRAELIISNGLFASTELGGESRPAIDVLRQVLSWRAGRFSFQPRETGLLPEPRASVGAIVLEAMRLEDEEKGPHHISAPPPPSVAAFAAAHASFPPAEPPSRTGVPSAPSSRAVPSSVPGGGLASQPGLAAAKRSSSAAIELDSDDLIDAVESLRSENLALKRELRQSRPALSESRVPSPPEVPRVSTRGPKKAAP